MSSALDQSTYQVRFDWGIAGLRRLAASDVVIVVDVLGLSADALAAAARGEDLVPAGADGGALVARAAGELAHGPVVLVAALRNAAAAARTAMAEQERRGVRTSIAVVAAGEPEESGLRFAVEDQLGAGAVIAALGDLGIDHCSPEAVSTAEAFRALRRAMKHLLTASGSGRALAGGERHSEVREAARLDDLALVPTLDRGAFRVVR
ncbi:2-phosphosulfolactate phosphatase [Microbacterium oryzae]|uniref:2-phosphosulfolactate phosphatase n=1 Tax=Microbacterium oryzae TaxID=743009 RepID=UPI0025AFB444|nr:2-phosphosulfolactate phosphatase [Microbacterium oryzae]MDN3310409.1 2-phosphosulfolactate phosphatase [Microbacterium oryzae]